MLSLEIGKSGIAIIITGTLLIAAASAFLVFWAEESEVNGAVGKFISGEAHETGEMMAAFDVVKAMGVGWNLGSTLDSIDNRKRGLLGALTTMTPEEFYETYWGNPITTVEMINTVAQTGFGAIRVPVTYSDHMDENFQIRVEWLERAEQVVNYVLDNDIYCIINIHHDTGYGSWPWLKADPGNIEQLEEQLRTVWIQIAEHFKDYGDKLIFESFNEILDVRDRWNNSNRVAYSVVNRFNQVFVDTVRATGGNNVGRYLIVKTYAAGTDEDIVTSFILPRDSAKGRLIVGAHTYLPLEFTWHQDEVFWAETYSDWDQQRDGRRVENIMRQLNDVFVDNGIPVIIGEFGAKNKRNTSDRVNYATHFVQTAKQYGISCFWWDDGGQFEDAGSVTNFALFDRYMNRWFFPEIAEAIISAANR